MTRFHEEIYSDPSSPTGLNQVCVTTDEIAKALTLPIVESRLS